MRNREAEEKIILEAIQSAREIQTFLWGESNGEWGLEEWKRMLRKRVEKIDKIDPNRPHSIVELRKRLLQNAALSIALIELLNHGMLQTNNKNGLLSNLPEYQKDFGDHAAKVVMDELHDHVYWTQAMADKLREQMDGVPLESQVEDPDNDPDIISARQMKSIYSEEILREIGLLPKRNLYFCEYCRQLVSNLDNHECEKGVR